MGHPRGASLSYFVVIYNTTAVNVAIGEISRDFGYSTSTMTWFVDAYVLVLAMTLVLGGRLGDMFGRRRIWTIGVVGVAATAVVLAVTPSGSVAIGTRAAMGLFTALMAPASLALIAVSFDPARRGKPLGIWAAVTQFGTIVGPLLGGVFAASLGWRFIFWFDVPLALLALLLMRMSHVVSPPQSGPRRIDWIGSLMLAVFPALLVIGVHFGGTLGWTSPIVLLLIAGGLCVGAMFPVVQRRISNPIIKVNRFSSPTFLSAILIAAIMYFIYLGVMYFQSLYLLSVLQVSALQAGLALVAMTGTTTVVSLSIGSIVDLHGYYYPIVIGMTAMSIALFWQAQVQVGDGVTTLIAPLVLLGFGLGLVFAPSQRAAVNAVAPSDQGTANGIVAMARQLGGSLGIGLLSALFITGLGSDVTTSQATPAEFIGALTPTLMLSAALAAAGLIIAVVFLRPKPKGPGGKYSVAALEHI